MTSHIWKSAIFIFLCLACKETPKKENKVNIQPKQTTDKKKIEKKEERIILNTHNAIPFLAKYGKKNPESKVRIVTSYGNIDIVLFPEVPYHRANFIFLTKNKYFDNTCFHRVVNNFIIQGGNSDSYQLANKRRKIGKYLLPPHIKQKYKHYRGVISMPSSDIDNPHQMASPYEFFIVQNPKGAHHLDGSYTVFGKVIKGMNVVDSINKVSTDERDWPINNIIIKEVKIIK